MSKKDDDTEEIIFDGDIFEKFMLTCKRCGYAWVPRHNKKPKVCPKCKNPNWNKDKA
jgi:rubrerythrin